MLKYHVLASGSTGNLTLIESANARVLIDCGVSGRKTAEKLGALGLSLEDIDLALVTHSHTDHIQGLPQISKVIRPALSHKLHSYVLDKMADAHEPLLFKANEPFILKDMRITPVGVSHDCVDPVCFMVESAGDKVGMVTDLGEVNEDLVTALTGARVVIMEANHDIQMIARSARPVSLKNRILSKVGHLSNRSSGRFLARIHTSFLEEVVLVHLSRDCNTPELALQTVKAEMKEKNIFFDRFRVAGPEGLSTLTTLVS